MANIEDLFSQHGLKIVRNQLKKIRETYPLQWRVMHELVQNAIDAIQVKETTDVGTIKFNIDLDEDTVEVIDDGCGFKRDLQLLCPGGTGVEKSFGRLSPTKGYQGVGLKAVMYSSEEFELESVHDKERWTFIAENLRDYVDTDEGNPDYDHEYKPSDAQDYTRVNVKFNGGDVLSVINQIGISLASDQPKWSQLYRRYTGNKDEQAWRLLSHFWSWYLKTETYVGCYNKLLGLPVLTTTHPEEENLSNIKDITVHLGIRSRNKFADVRGHLGTLFQETNSDEFACEVPNGGWSFGDIADENRKEPNKKYRISPAVVRPDFSDPAWEDGSAGWRNKLLEVKLKPQEDSTLTFEERYKSFKPLVEHARSKIKIENYRDALEKVRGIYLAISRTSNFELLGMKPVGKRAIACNGVVTDHELKASTTSSTWYENTIHLIVNVDSKLNIGKRHLVDNHIVNQINNLYNRMYPNLVRISQHLVEKRPDAGLPAEKKIDLVELDDLELATLSYKKVPSDENTLIGLFSQLVMELDIGLKFYGLKGKSTYDGYFTWEDVEPSSDAELKILEFKLRLSDLVDEFDRALDDKNFQDIDLVIAWEDDLGDESLWRVRGLTPDEEIHLANRGVPTKYIDMVIENNMGDYRPLIVVKDLVEKLKLA